MDARPGVLLLDRRTLATLSLCLVTTACSGARDPDPNPRTTAPPPAPAGGRVRLAPDLGFGIDGLVQPGLAVQLEEPTAEPFLRDERLVWLRDRTTVEYRDEFVWAEKPSAMLLDALREAFEANGLEEASSSADGRASGGWSLAIRVRAFQINRVTGAPDLALIGLDATILAGANRTFVASAGFAAERPTAIMDRDAVIVAFEEALSTVLEGVLVWLARVLQAPTA